MKNHLFILAIVILLSAGCEKKKTGEFTILGQGTPYSNFPEIMNRKVKSVTEKNYWAVAEGDSYKRGNPLTKADRDSLGGWTDDFEAVIDADGDLVVCSGMDEVGKVIWKNESVKENMHITRRNYYRNDTLRMYDVYKYGENGFMAEGTRFRAGVDTLMITAAVKTNKAGYPEEYQLTNSKGESSDKHVYTYDDQNRLVSFKVLDREGKTKYAHELKYNDKNKLSELTVRDKGTEVTAVNYVTYEYDEKGNWIKAIVKDLKERVVIGERSYTYF